MIGNCIQAQLAANPAIAAIVGTRIFPQKKNQPIGGTTGEPERPYVTYAVLSGGSGATLSGNTGIKSCRIQTRCWGDLYFDVDPLRDAIEAVLDGVAFTQAGVQVLYSGLTDFGDDYEMPVDGDDLGAQECSSDFKVCFRAA